MIAAVLCCAVGLVAGCYNLVAQQSLSALEWGHANAGLRMAVSPVAKADDPGSVPGFRVAIENVGESDVVLSLGTMLANGKVMFPTAVRLLLTDRQGTARELTYFDRRYPGVAGRIDDYLVALRAGSVYTILVSLDHYYSPTTKEYGDIKLAPGRHRIEARYDGQGAQALNLDTPGIGLLNFWKGTLRSNSLEFEVY